MESQKIIFLVNCIYVTILIIYKVFLIIKDGNSLTADKLYEVSKGTYQI